MTKAQPLRAFFGGTFDPPHVAHHQILVSLLNDSLLSSVHLVPAKLNPFKSIDAQWSSLAQRRQWVEGWLAHLEQSLSTEAYSKLHVEWHELESSSVEPSFTIDSLEKLSTDHGGQWVLVGGADLLVGLKKWKDIEELLERLHSFWIFARGSESWLEAFGPLDEELKARCEFRLMPERLIDVSSSEIRRQLLEIFADSKPASNALQKIKALPMLDFVKESLARLVQKADTP